MLYQHSQSKHISDFHLDTGHSKYHKKNVQKEVKARKVS